jgi:hypothetical protein
MAVSSKYGKLNIKSIGDDEPVFIIRAQDKLAIFAIEMYKEIAGFHDLPITSELQEEIERFRLWGGARKSPD